VREEGDGRTETVNGIDIVIAMISDFPITMIMTSG
jgi:hypothetical protein